MPAPFVGPRFVMLREVPPAVALARVVVAPGRYSLARELDDERRVVLMAVPGTLFEHPPVAVPSPRPFALHRDTVLTDPRFQIELPVPVTLCLEAGLFAGRR